MTEILGILGGIYTSAQVLDHFAKQTSRWRILSDRLFDAKEGLDAAQLSLKSWQRKYDVQDRRPLVYMHVLFGQPGWEQLRRTLGHIKMINRSIQSDIDKIVGRALRARPGGPLEPDRHDGRYDEQLVEDCLRRIKRSMRWSQKFKYSVLGRIDDLEVALERLHRKLTTLERFSDYYLELEHPDIFYTIKRLPGRRVILRIGDSRHDAVQRKLLHALRARKDAELLHRASHSEPSIHIGLSVPQIHERDFAFLLPLAGRTHEVLVHPVRFKAIHDRSRVQTNISSAVPTLIRNKQEPCYMLPSSAGDEGFQLSLPPTTLLTELEYRDPLSTLVRKQNSFLGQPVYPQDQIAIACGIAHGSFRLIGSRWLQFLDNRNIRWRRNAEGQWTSMMAAQPGDTSITRTLDQVLDSNSSRFDKRDLSKHAQIFRIGLVLTELALKTPISYIDFDNRSGGVRLFISGLNGDGEEVEAAEVAAEVENRTNVLMGNMVFTCLSALAREGMREKEIEEAYYRNVLSQADELQAFVKADRRRGSPAGTPRSGGSNPSFRDV
ncbi:hypothetical protein EJ04DRAFT_509668 [Polyplosphaeria fusca]|uniref:Uncharacterized protein n=1 Tax=Polyplosphaeria fusca TaxID=682080 RepID=A0A9P4V6F1_9PLEO|nr:hypothetical protein EJ04DRAFT_509668 [Polyplosphaeria fusca]